MDVGLALIALAIFLLIHLVFVNINIGVGLFSFIVRVKSIEDRGLEEVAKKAFRILVASEFVSGVFGTIITVVLAGLWTPMVNIITVILFFPLLLSLIGIILRLTSIVGFWYTWGMENYKLHLLIGFIMAVSGFMIPAGFRYIFAFIDYPMGLESINPVSGDIYKAIMNPVYPPLLIHTWLGATAIGLLFISTVFAFAGDNKVYLDWSRWASKFGGLATLLQLAIGPWLAYTLYIYSPYMAANIYGVILGSPGKIMLSQSMFLVMVGSGLILIFISLLYGMGKTSRTSAKLLAPLAILSLIAGEVSHDYSRYPYMVVGGLDGIRMESLLNYLLDIDSIIIVAGLVILIIILLVYLILIWYIFTRRYI